MYNRNGYRRGYVPYYFLYRGSSSGFIQAIAVFIVLTLCFFVWYVAVPAVGIGFLIVMVRDVYQSYKKQKWGELVGVSLCIPTYCMLLWYVLTLVNHSLTIFN